MLIGRITELLEQRTPFAFARFNDGEVGGIMEEGFIASRGAQKVSSELKQKLHQAITFKKDNYWIGIPCPQCYPDMNKFAEKLVGEYDYKTLAVELINKNYSTFINEVVPLLAHRSIHWVGGQDQNLNNLQQQGLLIQSQYTLPSRDAFSVYEDVKDLYKTFISGSVVIVSAGPLERVLVQEWFDKRDDVTYLGLGSMFDPWTRGVQYGYHTGRLQPCSICN